jgi:hypothetical protein
VLPPSKFRMPSPGRRILAWSRPSPSLSHHFHPALATAPETKAVMSKAKHTVSSDNTGLKKEITDFKEQLSGLVSTLVYPGAQLVSAVQALHIVHEKMPQKILTLNKMFTVCCCSPPENRSYMSVGSKTKPSVILSTPCPLRCHPRLPRWPMRLRKSANLIKGKTLMRPIHLLCL